MTDPQSDRATHPPAVPVRLAAAIGLVVAGLTTLIIAWAVGDDFVRPEPGPGWTRAATVLLILLVLTRIWHTVSGRDSRTITAVTSATAVVAVGVMVLSLLGLADQYRHGFPGPATLLAATGGLAVAIGTVLSLRIGPGTGWRPRLPGALSAVGTLLLVPAVAVPLVLTAPDWPVTATTAGPTTAAPVPESVSQVAWSTPIDGPINEVVAAGAGVVVRLDDGVVALDGTTGQIRWTRRRPGAEARQIMASPDGGTILTLTAVEEGPSVRLEAIDAFTGQVRFTRDTTISSDNIFGLFSIPMTDATYIAVNDDESEFYGRSLTDDGQLWTFRAPDGCQIIAEREDQKAAASGLIMPLMCGRQEPGGDFTEFRYVSVDATTGQQRWQRTVPLAQPMREITLNTQLTTDRRHFAVTVATTAPTRGLAEIILDTETGADVPAAPPLRLYSAGIAVKQGEHPQLIDLTSGAPIPAAEPVLSCTQTHPDTLMLRSGAVCRARPGNAYDRLSDGEVALDVARLADPATHPVPVRILTGPLDENRTGSTADAVRFVAAPGAVVVVTEMTPVEGHRVNVVGLR